jgi:polyphenol oxidase
MTRTNQARDHGPAPVPSAGVTRRDLLLGAGLAAGTLALSLGAAETNQARADHPEHRDEQQAPPFAFGSEPRRERKSFHDLTEEEVRTLCDAVGYMRDGSARAPLPLDHPLQWDQYVALHARHCTGEGHLQVHWSWFFLPWHRAYLFFLERRLAHIVTTVFKQDGSRFALPYWDWEHHKGVPNTRLREGKKKPSPFFGFNLDVDDLSDPDPYNLGLWDGYRGPALDRAAMDPAHEKGPVWKDHVAETMAYTDPKYIDSILGFPFYAFAGRKVTDARTGQGLLEIGPHNFIHDWVGSRQGDNRDMGTLRYAALDPLFYLHHAKVDEVWSRYPYQPDQGSVGDWYRQWFNFYDVDGKPVSVTVRDTVEKMTNVVYQRPATVAARPALDLPKRAPTEHTLTVVDRPATLTDKPVSLTPVERRGDEKLPGVKAEGAPARALLEFEVDDVSYSGKFTVRVFVNKPDARLETSTKDEHFIGTFGALDSHAGPRGAGRKPRPCSW